MFAFSLTLFAENEAPSIATYSDIWKTAGSNATLDSVFIINITTIPDSVTFLLDEVVTPIPKAVPNDGEDDSFSFSTLIFWLKNNIAINGIHAQIYIPPGTYNLSDQLVMYSNIGLKGDSCEAPELIFSIISGSVMDSTACNKDAILIMGSGSQPDQVISNVGIENLKIIRERESVSPEAVYDWVYESKNGLYPGNNIALVNANNCWIKGVESENTFRNHVTMQWADHVTISGVYFHASNKYRGGGFGYGVGLWDSRYNLITHSIFDFLRHGITVSDSSKYNVISYNYFLNQYSTEQIQLPSWFTDLTMVQGWLSALTGLSSLTLEQLLMLDQTDIVTSPRGDIAIHGEPTNCYANENNPIDPQRRPMYNLIEGNCLRSLEVDGTHMENGEDNTFLRNRVKGQFHVHGKDGYSNSILALYLTALAAFAPGPPDLALTLLLLPSVRHTCIDCLALRLADGEAFKNQPKQLFVNNYARERHWWRSQFQDYPLRMHSAIE